MYIIENQFVKAHISTQGAEIHSFKLKSDDMERMYQGNPEFWKGRNPVLFPQVGNTWNKSYETKGQQYAMGNHGFARNSEFELVSQTVDQVVLVLKSNAETLAQYPYQFELYVTYTLIKKRINIEYKIVNLDQEAMPFGFGLHPAFKCPVDDTETFEDYYLEFPSPEKQDNASGKYLVDKRIALNYPMFDDCPTLIYEFINSPYVDLKSSQYAMRVGCNGYRFLAFWTVKNAPFICIEPWHSHGDFEENHLPFDKREGMIILSSKSTYQTGYYFEIL